VLVRAADAATPAAKARAIFRLSFLIAVYSNVDAARGCGRYG
jgi:hypothetical protein